MFKRMFVIIAAATCFLPIICMEKKRESEQALESITKKPKFNIAIINVCIAKKMDTQELCKEEFRTKSEIGRHLREKHNIELSSQNEYFVLDEVVRNQSDD